MTMISPNENLNHLLQNNNIEIFNEDNPAHLDLINEVSLNEIHENNGHLTEIPPYEKHPYLHLVNFDHSASGLMIGTFPPISYLCDTLNLPNLSFNNIINPPVIPFFHGNYASFWRYAPINFEEIILQDRDLQPGLIQNALIENGVIYTDIIKFTQRELKNNNGVISYTAEDKLLQNIIINDSVYDNLIAFKAINRLYFTNASFFGSNNRNSYLFDRYGNYILSEKDAFRLFLKGANEYGFKIDFALNEEENNWININEGIRNNVLRRSINQSLTTKVIIKLRLTLNNEERILQIYSSVSPAAVNRGSVRQNNCVQNFSQLNGIDIADSPKELLNTVLFSFFNNTIDQLHNYNA